MRSPCGASKREPTRWCGGCGSCCKPTRGRGGSFLPKAEAMTSAFRVPLAPLTTLDVILVSLPIACVGPIGDRCESLWKRACGVKDSGNLIPGHGGMLDRVDAVFFVAPWVLAYVAGIKPLLG